VPHILQSLLDQLDLEQLEMNLFRGRSTTLGPPRVFGGQVIGQALIAALRTVEDRLCHSLHGYFLRPGDPGVPIVYEVDRIRDGRSFTTRRVVAIQKGEAIFNMATSFHIAEEGLSHQIAMPEIPAPEDCFTEEEIFEQLENEIPEEMHTMMLDRPIEIRRVEPISMLSPKAGPPYQHLWFRTRNSLPEDPALHQCILAYVSDMGFFSTCTLPHGKSFVNGLITASLDHALWFHRPFKVDEWILFAQESPASAGARGFNRGSMYSRDGVLIGSVAQEALMREINN